MLITVSQNFISFCFVKQFLPDYLIIMSKINKNVYAQAIFKHYFIRGFQKRFTDLPVMK